MVQWAGCPCHRNRPCAVGAPRRMKMTAWDAVVVGAIDQCGILCRRFSREFSASRKVWLPTEIGVWEFWGFGVWRYAVQNLAVASAPLEKRSQMNRPCAVGAPRRMKMTAWDAVVVGAIDQCGILCRRFSRENHRAVSVLLRSFVVSVSNPPVSANLPLIFLDRCAMLRLQRNGGHHENSHRSKTQR